MAIDFKLIGERIKSKRKLSNMTQEQLAEKLNVTVGYVSQCERGISKINLEKLSEVADILQCDIAYFVSGSTLFSENYSTQEYEQKYSKLNSKQKKQIIKFIDIMLEY